jgi:uncharacterized protein YodC (DUF2158 family)
MEVVAKEQFKAGDLVVLKSGGPTMTVDRTGTGGSVWATWFAGPKREHAHFSSESLKMAPEKPEGAAAGAKK